MMLLMHHRMTVAVIVRVTAVTTTVASTNVLIRK